MRLSIPILLIAASTCLQVADAQQPAHSADACPAVLNYIFNRLQSGKPESLCQYRGKVLLIVNTASYCGYTHQYEGLEALYPQIQGSRSGSSRLSVKRFWRT